MARSLRKRSDKNYKEMNDLSKSDLKLIYEKEKSLSWKERDTFPIKILEKSDGMLKIHYDGWSSKYDEVISASEVVQQIPPGPVNGPVHWNDFVKIMAKLIFHELSSFNHRLCEREIRIETNAELTEELKKALLIENFDFEIPIAKFTRILGYGFDRRFVSSGGDCCFIAGNITCRILRPKPEIYFKNVNNILVEHHEAKNPVLIVSFVVTKEPGINEDSDEF